MPVTLSIVESTTELNTVVTEVILESASTPGPPGVGVPAGGTTGQALVKASDTDYDTEWAAGGSGADDQTAAEVPFTPAGNLASTDVQDALEELDAEKAAVSHAHAGEDITSGTVADARIASTIARDSEVTSAISALSSVYQPLDSDLTSIAALSTTAFGRGLLELANQAALLSAAGAAAASHAHAGEDITSGTVADARIASTIARDSEVTSAISALSTVYQPLDSDLTSIAALSTTSFGRGLLELANQAALLSAAGAAAASHAHSGGDITSGTVAEARIHADIARDSEVTSAISALSSVYQPLDSDLTSIASLTTTSFGRGLLELANAAALLSAAGGAAASHTHAAGDIASGEVALARGGTGASLADPGADRIGFWDDSAGAFTWLTAGSGLTITDTTMTASGSSVSADDENLIIHMEVFA